MTPYFLDLNIAPIVPEPTWCPRLPQDPRCLRGRAREASGLIHVMTILSRERLCSGQTNEQLRFAAGGSQQGLGMLKATPAEEVGKMWQCIGILDGFWLFCGGDGLVSPLALVSAFSGLMEASS